MIKIYLVMVLLLLFDYVFASTSEIHIEDIIGWLPVNTETLVVNQKPVSISTTHPENMIGACELIPLGILLGLVEEKNFGTIIGKRILLYVEGSRKFRSPKQLGLMPYDGCHIYLMEDSTEPYMRLIQSITQRYFTYKKLKIYTSKEKLEKDLWSFYIVSPRPDMIIIATQKDYLLKVIDRMNQPAKDRAFPSDLLEWNYIDTTAHIWGIRHYSKSNSKYDPTSPLTYSFDTPDKEAIGFTFSFNLDKSPNPELRYISNNKNAVEIMRNFWHNIEWANLNPAIDKLDEYTTRMILNLSTKEEIGNFFFIFDSQLGHGIFL